MIPQPIFLVGAERSGTTLLRLMLKHHPCIGWVQEFEYAVDLIRGNNFPKLQQWFDLCSQRDSVKPTAKTREEIIKVYDGFIKVDYSFGGLNKNKDQ